PAEPERRADDGSRAAAALADDRAEDAEGMDGAEGRRRRAGRGDVPRSPGAAVSPADESRAPRDPGTVDAELPSRGAVRRDRSPAARAGGARPARRAPHGRQPARQRRRASPRPAATRP